MRIKNANMQRREEAANELERIAGEIGALLQEARDTVSDHPSYSNWDAYVFAQIDEHIECANPYNQSLNSVAAELRDTDEDGEPIEAWGEQWDEEDDDE